MFIITTENDGQQLVKTNYFDCPWARAGKLYCCCIAAAIRVLVPESLERVVSEMLTANYVICSVGPGAVELLFEDHTDAPFAVQLSNNSFSLLPGQPSAGKEWIVSVWVQRDGRPHKVLELPCRWRRVRRIPWLKPW